MLLRQVQCRTTTTTKIFLLVTPIMADELCTESAGISGVKETLGKREATKLLIRKRLALKNEERVKLRQIRSILRKEMNQRSSDDVEYLCRYPKLVNELSRRKEKKRQLEERIKEVFNHFLGNFCVDFKMYSSN